MATTEVAAEAPVSPITMPAVEVRGDGLTLAAVDRVAACGSPVRLSADPVVRARVDAAQAAVARALEGGRPVYGINTGFGGMADVAISAHDVADLQENLLFFLRTGAGEPLPEREVRAAMLLRLNSHLRGASGLRWELIERFATLLNAGVTPVVRDLGSIGASGDLVPLAAIARVVTGLDPNAKVNYRGQVRDAKPVLAELGLSPMRLEPKEGLALVNGTAVSTGVASCCVLDAAGLLSATLAFHAIAMQALRASAQALDPFIHMHKAHPGQLSVARAMRNLLAGSELVTEESHVEGLVQDRYSLRCLPQFLGPAFESVDRVGRELETEANAATDNPLIDAEGDRILHCGNFLAQYVSCGLDALRAQMALAIKHVDVQVALLMSPEFSNGLPASLVGNTARRVNMGLKGLQIAANSVMPLATYLSAPLADRFPTHAEQFNQNVNSQSFGAGYLTKTQLDHVATHLAMSMLAAMQALELRCRLVSGRCTPHGLASPAAALIYDEICAVVGREPSADRPYVNDDADRDLEADVERLAADLRHRGRVVRVAEGLGAATAIVGGAH